MAIAGNLADFSLPEIFQFLEHQQGTGLLLVQGANHSLKQERKENYVWLEEGRIVAVADRLDNQGLTFLISQRRWLKIEELRQIVNRCPKALQTPLGISLKDRGALSAEQLKLLFYVQVLLRVCALFKLKNGQFIFDTTAILPNEEMTGLSLPATEATLLGLRVLRDWTSLAAKLPAPNLILRKAVASQSRLHLDSQERQVWESLNGKSSIQAIAEQLHLSLTMVQQIAYRLSIVDLVEEVPIITDPFEESNRAGTPARYAIAKYEGKGRLAAKTF